MIIKDLNLNKQLFTIDELKLIENMLQSGQSKHIMSALINLDPEKEAELQRIINKMTPIDDGFESEVRKMMEKQIPNGPQTPEEEEIWNKRLQEEYKVWLESQELRREEIEKSLSFSSKNTQDEVITINNNEVHKIGTQEPQDNINKLKELKKLVKNETEKVKELKKEIKKLEKELK